MAGYIKELLIDLSMNRLPIELRSDLIVAIQQVINSGAFSAREIKYLDLYLCGYSSEEIAAQFITTTDIINESLSRIMTAIEHTSGYTDITLYRRIQLLGKYSRIKLQTLKDFLMQHGEVFTYTKESY